MAKSHDESDDQIPHVPLTELVEWFNDTHRRFEEQVTKTSTIHASAPVASTARDTALLQAYASQEVAVGQVMSLMMLSKRLALIGREGTNAISTLSQQISGFTTKADEGTRALARWTGVLAVATLLLFLATAVLVFATWRLK